MIHTEAELRQAVSISLKEVNSPADKNIFKSLILRICDSEALGESWATTSNS